MLCMAWCRERDTATDHYRTCQQEDTAAGVHKKTLRKAAAVMSKLRSPWCRGLDAAANMQRTWQWIRHMAADL